MIIIFKKWVWVTFLFPGLTYAMSTNVLAIMSTDEVGTLPIKNDTKVEMRYYVKALEISSPYKDSHELKGNESVLNASERYFVLPPGGEKKVTLTYQGKKNEEHYYQLSVQERVVCENCKDDVDSANDNKKSRVSINSMVQPIVVVLPEKPNYSYEYKNGIITNAGDASLIVMLDDACSRDALRTWIVTPKHSVTVPKIKQTEQLSIGMKDRIVNVTANVCAKK
ncbi:hypothetical protein [Aeromonas enteropelogenes]|uniref:hypothetical protein n=1 Tax=Aeromonas enteropelogenes TaxID=29489 RepID=UPI003BA33384